jgi:sporulation integral membrane protein YtvI
LSNFSKAMIALALVLVGTYFGVRYLLPLVSPFVIALFLAILIEPGVAFANTRLRVPRGLAVFVVLLLLSGLMLTGLSLGVAEIAGEIDRLSRNMGGLSRTIVSAIESLISATNVLVEELPQPIADYINSQQETVVSLLQTAVAVIGGVLAQVPQFALVMLISIVATFFISKDYRRFSEGMVRSVPPKWRQRLGGIRTELLASFAQYLRSRFVLVAITTVTNLVGLSIMGVNYAWLLGLACGVLDVLPLLGPAAVFLPWIVYHVIIGNYGYALGLLAVHAISSGIRQAAELRVMQKNLDLHPLMSLLSLYVGSKLFGAVGLIIGPLSVIFVKAVYQSIIAPMFPSEEEE